MKVKLPPPLETQHTWVGVVHVEVPHASVPPLEPPLLEPLLPPLDPPASPPELPPLSATVPPLLDPAPLEPLLAAPLLEVLPPLLPVTAPEELPLLLEPTPPELPDPLLPEASPPASFPAPPWPIVFVDPLHAAAAIAATVTTAHVYVFMKSSSRFPPAGAGG